jgi:hypothetical protein
MSRGGFLLVLAALLSPTAAQAGEYYYFYKSGVTRDVFRAEKVECEELAAGAKPGQVYQPPAQNVYAAGAGAFMAGFMRSRERRQMRETIERRCMSDKGYARIAVDKAVIKETGRLKGEERVTRMAEMAGAPEPLGERLPE